MNFPFRGFHQLTAVIQLFFQLGGILFIIMNGPDIGCNMRYTACPVERTGRVDHFRQIIEVVHQARILYTVRPELLVGRRPDQE